MNYIVFDLEWNQCPDGKEKEIKDMPFEIIEIGAVKLDSQRRVIDTFAKNIAPGVYQTLHPVMQDLIGTTMGELVEKGVPFPQAVKEIMEWCGDDYIFCTWGCMDLTELQRNCDYYKINLNLPMPLIYYDLQKSYSICYDDGKKRSSLETVTADKNIVQNEAFHSAFADAEYTAKIFGLMDMDKIYEYTSVDTYKIPSSRAEEFTLVYPTYSKFISKGYRDREKIMLDGVIRTTKCFLCNREIKQRIKWFSNNQHVYYCVAYCENHGLFKGKIRFKKTEDDLYYAIKILKQTDENGVAEIIQKQDHKRERRRAKRSREKQRQRQGAQK